MLVDSKSPDSEVRTVTLWRIIFLLTVASMLYKTENERYLLNLIDTPVRPIPSNERLSMLQRLHARAMLISLGRSRALWPPVRVLCCWWMPVKACRHRLYPFSILLAIED